MDFFQTTLAVPIIMGVLLILGIIAFLSRFYHKTSQGQALVKTGVGGIKVNFNSMLVIPVLHKVEIMDISLNTITIERRGKDGLVCKDNLRADISVAFYVRVNEMQEDVKRVAQSVGCSRASSKDALRLLFDAKFSEALKTVGKKFDFVDLYNQRDEFRKEIIDIIGTDLNGYILDDAAIDFLEQTPLESLDPNNILDAEGIKKITEITAREAVKSNFILRDKEKTIKQQDVEAREAVLVLERQLAESEEKQKREVANIRAREGAEILRVNEEERLKSERARITTEEELQVAEENKLRQVIVAAKNKERTEAIENERVEKDRQLEATERERIVTLTQIEKEKAIEHERKNIQEVIRERVAIEKTVVDEEERIKDTRAYAEAERLKKVALTEAEQRAEAALVEEIKRAEAAKQSAEFNAKRMIIDAEAEQQSASQKAEAVKVLAEAEAAREAAKGMAEAQVMEAKAAAREKQGEAEASVLEDQALAEAKGIEAKSNAQAEADLRIGNAAAEVNKARGLAEAEVIRKKAEADKEKGLADAQVLFEKAQAEAEGIDRKAKAMKTFNEAGKEHEEFKLRLDKDLQIELAGINIQRDIADAQAEVLSEALKNAKIDIVGGEQVFFDKIVGAITQGKSMDRTVYNSDIFTELKGQLLDPNGKSLLQQVKEIFQDSNLKSDDIRNLSVAVFLNRLMSQTEDPVKRSNLQQMLQLAKSSGIGNNSVQDLGIL
ncbi:flotillin family protein [Croceimicrobium hydrocarbonivorans]|uniref:Flotillin family protein n=1 Tax=Croceimicrobium hydrocarbonivorans TaxID=2761580 RepID=A0A7H0VHM4_9FLAO|nr:flotillin family protein [Croceimicrobium hydrocarbonivorans]QNR25222.1 flotillin family protein [Croceimicrobium hydrocarbonivorans]